jgi:phage gp36-like protein
MAFATPTQMLERFDPRDIGELCADDSVPIDRITLLTDTVLQAALDDASGDILAALNVAGRYTSAELTALTGDSAKYLARITCELALSNLWGRKPLFRTEDRLKALEVAEKRLERLRKGEHVFAHANNIDAGTPSVDGPTTVGFENLNLLRDRTRNYYPRRVLPGNR